MNRPGSRLFVAFLCIALAGCAMVKLKEQSEAFYSSTVLVGRIAGPPGWDGPVVVAALTKGGAGTLAHHTMLHEPGGFELIVPKGEYEIVAFGDANRNNVFDAGEPTGRYDGPAPIVASGTGVIAALDLMLVDAAPARAPIPVGRAFAPRHDTQAGALARLDDPVFSADYGLKGYWAPMEFFREAGGNIYFLEPYDPGKTPVLFVHGAGGSPQDWRYFFDHIDRRRYQPWFFHYPSGAAVESMAHLLFWKLFNLQLKYRFEEIHLTAHSMGGLVARTFLVDHGSLFPYVKLFVSLSTPWAGEPAADLGVQHSPAVIPSWRDLRPEGRFMRSLFERKLPPGVDYYLFFGHKGGYSLLRPNNDGAITLASQLRMAAQAEARMIHGFDEDHAGIVSSPQVFAQYAAILDHASRRSAKELANAGNVRLRFSYEGDAGGPKSLPLLMLTPAEAGRAKVLLSLTAQDEGREIGPIPAGAYEASLFADAFRTQPRLLRVVIAPGEAPTLRFRFVPQGTLSGYVGARVGAEDNSAGSYRAPDRFVRISSVVLSGAGIHRTLVPRDHDGSDSLARYLAGEDDAFRATFSFVNLPPGDYELTIRAEGYRPHTSRHVVVPGRQAPMEPIELVPLAGAQGRDAR